MFRFCAAFSACLLPIVAAAADRPVRVTPAVPPAPLATPVANWSGVYGGLIGTYANLRSAVDDNTAPFGIDQFDDADKFAQKSAGFMGGLALGYNWRTGAVVMGLEADLSAAAISKTTFAAPDSGDGMQTKMSALGTLRGRFGYLVTESVLAYATAGLVYANLTQFAGDKDGGSDGRQYWDVKNSVASLNHWQPGWVVGAGVEALIDANWSVRAEYLYADLGKHTASATATDNGDFRRGEFSNKAHIARLGLNYRLGGATVVPVVAKC